MDPTAGGQNFHQVLTDFHPTQPGDGKTVPQCSRKASSDRGRVQVIQLLKRLKQIVLCLFGQSREQSGRLLMIKLQFYI